MNIHRTWYGCISYDKKIKKNDTKFNKDQEKCQVLAYKVLINHCCIEFILGNTKICLHFLSFPNTKIAWEVKTIFLVQQHPPPPLSICSRCHGIDQPLSEYSSLSMRKAILQIHITTKSKSMENQNISEQAITDIVTGSSSVNNPLICVFQTGHQNQCTINCT